MRFRAQSSLRHFRKTWNRGRSLTWKYCAREGTQRARASSVEKKHDDVELAGVHFVLRGKNAGNFELLSLISKSHATVVSVPGGGTILCSSLYDICCLLSYKFQE